MVSGTTILADYQMIVPSILNIAVSFGAKKPEFEAVDPAGGTSMIKSDLETLNGNTHAFSQALISGEPVSVSSVS